MSPLIRSCALCGWAVYGWEGFVSWMNQFRGLCSGPEGIILTGVGLFNDPGRGAFIAPPDPNGRWNDPDYEAPDEDQFSAMADFRINGKRGFLFHDACWTLLERAFDPDPVPRVRLFEVCDSLPLNLGGSRIDWGHDYGGLSIINDNLTFPWEDRFFDRQFPDGLLSDPYNADPLARDEVDRILTETPQQPPGYEAPLPRSVAMRGKDPFGSLPLELCSSIATYLPTLDVLNVRLVSRSFVHIFDSQQFWASRFKPGSDRSWVFEAQGLKGASSDWRWLCRSTADGKLGPGLRNRKRIWGLIQHLAALLELQWCKAPCPGSGIWHLLPNESRDWLVAVGSTQDQPESLIHLQKGCKRFHRIQVAIPSEVSQISASIARLGKSQYISGISFSTAAGQDLHLGYHNRSERRISLSGLLGINLAVGLGGIHALQCIDIRTKQPTAWLGCPDDAPKTERLVVGTGITALEVGFDGFRMVSISVANQPDLPQPHGSDKLRRLAIWYPDVPPPTVDLNEEFFRPYQPYTAGFRPLFWCPFGGPGGIHLQHLTKLTASCWDGLLRMEFSFDKDVPFECQRFGRHEDSEDGQVVVFHIDGPGGEVINEVEILQQYPAANGYAADWMYEEGLMMWFKLSTNHGRTC